VKTRAPTRTCAPGPMAPRGPRREASHPTSTTVRARTPPGRTRPFRVHATCRRWSRRMVSGSTWQPLSRGAHVHVGAPVIHPIFFQADIHTHPPLCSHLLSRPQGKYRAVDKGSVRSSCTHRRNSGEAPELS
jgi:hypothetical protein